MSETFEKRLDGASRRQSRLEKERKEKKKVRLITLIVVTVLALIFASAMFINSKLIRRILPAITIGDVNFSAVEYDYYFTTAYNEYQNQMYSYLGEGAIDYLPSTDSPLSEQVQNEETGETWEDNFANSAIQRMTGMAQIYSAAMAAGYKLPADSAEEISSQITDLKEQAEMYGFPSFARYLQQVFGSSMTEASLRKIMERSFLASSYSKHIYDSYEYSTNELAAYYSENADSLDKFIFRVFTVEAEPIEHDHETEEEYVEEDEAANEASVAAAREMAALIASGINSVDDFISAAKEYNEVYYGEPDSTLVEYSGSDLINLDFGDWLQDSARTRGNVMTQDIDTGSYVVCFVERDKNEYRTVNMRQIQVVPEMVDSSVYDDGEEDPEYLVEVQQAEANAEARATEALNQFTNGGGTQEKLIELMEEYSSDSTEGGLYENLSKGYMPQEINDWLFDPARKEGDYKLIKTDYGHHLVFFVGFGERSCDVSAENGLRERDYGAWTESLVEAEPVTRWAFSLTQKH